MFLRYFNEVASFIQEALTSNMNNKVYVNCVFGKSRSTTCVVAFLMLCKDWSAQQALEHIKRRRNVQLNSGFLQQVVDLENKLSWFKQYSGLPANQVVHQ